MPVLSPKHCCQHIPVPFAGEAPHLSSDYNRLCAAQYDAQLRDYYLARSGKDLDWSYSIRKALNEPVRPHMLPFLQKQGLLKQ